MALVVFLRGVNVGGHKAFKPAALAKDLENFDAVNIGAAGTFVIRKAVGQSILRNEISRRLPFEAEIMICKGSDVIALAGGSFSKPPTAQDVSRFVSVLAKRPRAMPRLPISQPAGDKWQVRITGVSGLFAVSHFRRQPGRTMVYPNEVVEKNFGVPATTRNWNTIETISRVLQG